MDNIYIYMAIGTLVVFGVLGWYLRRIGRKELKQEAILKANEAAHLPSGISANPEMRRLQLQAYERLIIFTERVGLANLISKYQLQDLSAHQFQSILVQQIKTEFEYNISQQLYVSPAAWDAVKNLKEQNIYIINQLAAMLPPEANAMDLSKQIVQFLSHDENASLQGIVSALLQKEARVLMM